DIETLLECRRVLFRSQAKAYYPDEPIICEIITDHLELLGNKKWQELSRLLNISLTKIKKVADCIQTLDPKPCSGMSNPSPANYRSEERRVGKECSIRR